MATCSDSAMSCAMRRGHVPREDNVALDKHPGADVVRPHGVDLEHPRVVFETQKGHKGAHAAVGGAAEQLVNVLNGRTHPVADDEGGNGNAASGSSHHTHACAAKTVNRDMLLAMTSFQWSVASADTATSSMPLQ
eukprot:TRINITY_DN1945_c0_g1_i2.p1 TRINITY_DN1945_c0_g1~~TRINITY_DN1945_c0_g1_i2.p1  ORF type:complete len:135 (+),score=22.10 TRINITY_DN1945_c0_g1_i2:248-652(+)